MDVKDMPIEMLEYFAPMQIGEAERAELLRRYEQELSMLKDDLRNLLQAGARNPGQPQYRRLAKGLTIGLKANDEFVSLQLSRNNVYPSAGEWKTVLNHWPEQYAIEKEPAQVEKGNKFYLIGKLRRTPDLISAGGDGQ